MHLMVNLKNIKFDWTKFKCKDLINLNYIKTLHLFFINFYITRLFLYYHVRRSFP